MCRSIVKCVEVVGAGVGAGAGAGVGVGAVANAGADATGGSDNAGADASLGAGGAADLVAGAGPVAGLSRFVDAGAIVVLYVVVGKKLFAIRANIGMPMNIQPGAVQSHSPHFTTVAPDRRRIVISTADIISPVKLSTLDLELVRLSSFL